MLHRRIQFGLRPETSLYLDLLRIAAVVLVLLDHTKRDVFLDGFLLPLSVFGQEAVAIFFVLSGLVIANATFTREQTLADYLIARLARLWSVVIPAVLLTIALDRVGTALAPGIYAQAWAGWHLDAASAWQALSPILFLNSAPPFDVSVGSNGPFWSLSYEAWYYVAFGVAVFTRGAARIAALLAIALFVGQNILVLAPLWLLGVAVWSRLGRGGASPLAWAAWLVSFPLILAALAVKYRLIAMLGTAFPKDIAAALGEKYPIALLIALNIIAFDRIAPAFAPIAARLRRPVRFVVDRSFSMYLYQAPLLFFVAALARDVSSRPLRIILFFAFVAGAVAALAPLTEQRKSTVSKWLRRFVDVRRQKSELVLSLR